VLTFYVLLSCTRKSHSRMRISRVSCAASGGSAADRQSGGYYKSLVAAAGARSMHKKAEDQAVAEAEALGKNAQPRSSRDQRAEAAGDMAAIAVLAAGGEAEAAAVAREQAMRRVIDAYHAGAAAASAAAAEVGVTREADKVLCASVCVAAHTCNTFQTMSQQVSLRQSFFLLIVLSE